MFPEFIKKKTNWILLIASNLLDIKKRSLDDYLADCLHPEMPLDEIGIMMFARMMHKHVTVCFNDLLWMTRRDDDSTNVDCVLVYHGKCIYVPTVPLSSEEYLSKKQYLDTVRKAWNDNEAKWQFDAVTDAWSKNENACTLSDTGVSSTMSPEGGCTMHDKDDVACTLSDIGISCTMSPAGGCTVHEQGDDACTLQNNTGTVLDTNVIGTVSLVKNDEETEMLQDIKESFDIQPKEKPKPKPSRHSKRLKQKKKKKQQEAAHLNLSSSSGTQTTRNSQKTSKEVAAANIVSKSKKYVFACKQFGLRKHDLKKKPHRCPACKKLTETYKALIGHLKECHPDCKYRCKYCRKTFNSNSW